MRNHMDDIVSDEEQDYLWDRRGSVLYRVQLSVIYHRKRERFFAFWDRAFKSVAIIGGSAALANLGGPEYVKVAAGIVAVTSTLSLVFGFAESARRHSELASKFSEVEARIARRGERGFTEEDLNEWESEERLLETSEPATLGALVVACQNELARARDEWGHICPLSWWQRLTKHILDHERFAAAHSHVGQAGS